MALDTLSDLYQRCGVYKTLSGNTTGVILRPLSAEVLRFLAHGTLSFVKAHVSHESPASGKGIVLLFGRIGGSLRVSPVVMRRRRR